jgi:hypothetical protein
MRELSGRLREALPGLDISESRQNVRRRAREWAWPACQMAIASALDDLAEIDDDGHDGAVRFPGRRSGGVVYGSA